MSDDKVVPLHDQISVHAPDKPVEEIVKMLEKLLEEARSGKVRGLVLIASNPNLNQFRIDWSHEGVSATELIGLCEIAKFRLTLHQEAVFIPTPA